MITHYIATMWSASALGGSLFASIFPNVSDLMADATSFSAQSSIGASLQSRPPLKAAWAGKIAFVCFGEGDKSRTPHKMQTDLQTQSLLVQKSHRGTKHAHLQHC